MILVNTSYITGEELETLEIVRGSTIQSRHFGKSVLQVLQSLVGGELRAYTEMMDEARTLATTRMVEAAQELGANGVVNIRYASATVMTYITEVIAYGTAVKFKQKQLLSS